MDFDWDEANTEHIARHGVDPDEAEEALSDPARVATKSYMGANGEKRVAVIGQSESGRYLTVIFTVRHGTIRVVTARDAEPNEKKRYNR